MIPPNLIILAFLARTGHHVCYRCGQILNDPRNLCWVLKAPIPKVPTAKWILDNTEFSHIVHPATSLVKRD